MIIDQGTPEEAPEWLVRSFARQLDIGSYRAPHRDERAALEARLAAARTTINTVWRHAHLAGQAFATERQPARIYLCNACPQREKVEASLPQPGDMHLEMRVAFEAPLAEVLASMTAKKDDPAQAVEQLRQQAQEQRNQGNPEAAQRLDEQANQIERGEVSPS